MDKSVTHSFRSGLLDEVEHATDGLIGGEAVLRGALGRMWQVFQEDPDGARENSLLVPKQEDEDERDREDERESRMARAPDLTPAVHKLFLPTYPVSDPSQFTSPEMQMETLDKALATLRELQDDVREYVERLQEIREGLGDIRAQRNNVWEMVREKAVKELHTEAMNTLS
jgi:hypothetical protein